MNQSYFFEAFGSFYEIRIDQPVKESWLQKIVPGFKALSSPTAARELLDIITDVPSEDRGLYYRGERLCWFSGIDDETAQGIEGNIQFVIAKNAAPDLVFVHAGAVSVNGAGILFPSGTKGGKTTLARAFLELGADYFTDDCTVIDRQGRLHPYPSHLKIRSQDSERTWLDPAEAGYSVATEPVKIGAVILTGFEAASEFRPLRAAPGETIMGILANLFLPSTMQDFPEETMAAARAAVDGALLLKGPRGDAKAAARQVVDLLDAR